MSIPAEVVALPHAEILWHGSPSMTRHYGVAQVVELHAALEKIKEDRGRRNKSMATLRLEHGQAEAKRMPVGEEGPPKVAHKEKRPSGVSC